MGSWSRLRRKLKRFILQEAYVSERVATGLVATTGIACGLTFLMALRAVAWGGPPSTLAQPLLLTLSFVYSVLALVGSEAFVGDIRGPALFHLSQPISKTTYAAAWLVAVAAAPLAALTAAFLLSLAVIDPVLLDAVGAGMVALWVLDGWLVSSLLLLAALLTRRTGAVTFAWLAVALAPYAVAALLAAQRSSAAALALTALMVLRPLLNLTIPVPSYALQLPLTPEQLTAASLALAAALTAAFLYAARSRLEV